MNGSKLRTSVSNTIDLLYEICEHPENFIEDDKWLAALATQTSLAEFSEPSRDIVGCSINSFKSISSNLFIEGFPRVNSTRRRAKELLETLRLINVKKPRSHRSYSLEIEALRLSIARYDGDIHQIMAVVEKQKYLARTLANHHQLEGRVEFWISESQKIDQMIQSIGGGK